MIHLRGLRKRFGSLEVLKGIDLRVRKGVVTAVLGPNGSGKTTLIKSILGLVRPDSGSIEIADEVLNGEWGYRSNIGYMPQIVRFPENLSGIELAAMLSDLRGAQQANPDEELLSVLGVSEDFGRPFRQLSGGTRQKVNAALAFRFRPDLMILDEPTAGLDPVASRQLRNKVRTETERGCTFLITSHDMAYVDAISDDVAFLLDGTIRYHGSVSDLKERTGQSTLEEAVAELMLAEEPASTLAGVSA